MTEHLGGEDPEHARAEQDPRRDLADHPWLADPLDQPADQLDGDEYHDHRQQQPGVHLRGAHAPGLGGCCTAPPRSVAAECRGWSADRDNDRLPARSCMPRIDAGSVSRLPFGVKDA